MIIAIIILGVVIIGLIVLISFLSYHNRGDLDVGVFFFFGVWLIICCVTETSMIMDITQKSQPKAMDVYQGKTTLEYTIRDGVKVDSVVVFKENIYEKKLT